MQKVLFEESQRMAILIVVIGAISLPFGMIAIAQIVSHKPVGNHPLPSHTLVIIALASICGSILISFLKLKLRITTAEINISFGILTSPKTIKLSEIKSITLREYDAKKEFFGAGVRHNSTTDCFTVTGGDIGLELTLANDRKILIGTERQHDLRLALEDEVFEGIYKK